MLAPKTFTAEEARLSFPSIGEGDRDTLVERLRTFPPSAGGSGWIVDKLRLEAAAEIERLRELIDDIISARDGEW